MGPLVPGPQVDVAQRDAQRQGTGRHRAHDAVDDLGHVALHCVHAGVDEAFLRLSVQAVASGCKRVRTVYVVVFCL